MNGKDDILRWKSTKNKYVSFNNNWCRIIVLDNGTVVDQVENVEMNFVTNM